MEIEFRIDMYSLSKRAINEFYLVELSKKKYDFKGIEYSDEEFDPTVFEPIDLDAFFIEFIDDKEKYSTILDALEKIISDLYSYYNPNYQQYLYKFVEEYFGQNLEYQKVAQTIKNYFDSEEGQYERSQTAALYKELGLLQDKGFADSFLIKLSEKFDYFPYDSSPNMYKTHNPQNLKCADEDEKDYVGEGGISRLMDLRDYNFSVAFYPNNSYLDGTPFTENELTARVCMKQILLEGYWAQILQANRQFHILVKTINEAIDDKWNILLTKLKRGIYCDEWGVTHQEAWDKDLRYFALNVAANSDNVPTLLLYFDIDFDEVANDLYTLTYGCDQIILSFILKTDDDELWEIKKLKGTSLKNKKEEFVVSLCSFLFLVKLKYGDKSENDSDIDESMNDDSLNPNLIVHNSSDNGRDFEFWAKEKLENLGYTISLTPITGDQGVDIIATRNGKKYAIQCKSYSGQVGNAAVQEVIAGKIFYDCDYACVVTNSSFTPFAYQLAAKAGVIMCANENLDSLK